MAIKASEHIWCNGNLIPWDDAKLHVMAHVVNYGSSVFEGIRCYHTEKGPAVFRLRDHMQRLLDSAKVYRMDADYSLDELIQGTVDVVGANKISPCYIRPIILRGYGTVGVDPTGSPIDVYIVNYEWGKYLGGEGDEGEVRRQLHELAAHQARSYCQRIQRRHRSRRERLRQRRLG